MSFRTVYLAFMTMCGDSIQKQLASWVQSRAAVIRQPLEQQYLDAEKEMAFLLSRQSKIERKKQIRRLAGLTLFAVSILGLMSFAYFSEVYYVKELYVKGLGDYLIYGGVALVGLYFVFTAVPMLEGVQVQLDEARYDRQLELLKDKLKRLELLRTLDPETLLQRRDLRPGETKPERVG